MAPTDLELRMTTKAFAAKWLPKRAIARRLDLAEGTVRYRLRRQASGALDGRAGQPHRTGRARVAIDHWLTMQPLRNLAALQAWLVAEHGYDGSLRSVQRYVAQAYQPPQRRARRRVETPPGAQAQVDWAQFPGIVVAGQAVTLQAFHMVLSHSRMDAVVWMPGQDQSCRGWPATTAPSSAWAGSRRWSGSTTPRPRWCVVPTPGARSTRPIGATP